MIWKIIMVLRRSYLKISKFNYQFLFIFSVDKQQEYDNNPTYIYKCIFMKRTILKLQTGYTCKSKLQGWNPKYILHIQMTKHWSSNPIIWIIYLINK